MASDTDDSKQALRNEINRARADMSRATATLKYTMDIPARTQQTILEHPVAITAAALAVGFLAGRVLPGFLWRNKVSVLGHLVGRVVDGTAMALIPVVTDRLHQRFFGDSAIDANSTVVPSQYS